jgi:hypothetical protein
MLISNPWAIMFILARGGATYARLKFNAGPGGEQVLPVEVDYGQDFSGTDQVAWQEEYQLCVQTADSLIVDEPTELDEHAIDPWELEDDYSGWSRDDDPWSWSETESEVAYER